MHLSLLALLLCVLSLGGQHVVPQKADMPRLRGRGSGGVKIGGSMVTERERESVHRTHAVVLLQCTNTLLMGTWLTFMNNMMAWRVRNFLRINFFIKKKRKCSKALCSVKRYVFNKISRRFHSGLSLVLKVNLKLKTLHTACINV